MAGLLTDYLRASAGRTFQWGSDDCYWWIVDWLHSAGVIFDDSFLRRKYFGRYDSKQSCLEIVAREGGWDAVMTELAQWAGIEPRIGTAVNAGDITMLKRAEHESVFGIYVGDGKTCVRQPQGIAVVRCDITLAYAVLP